ncbi:MAG: glycosyltransferase [Oligoflexales bacterium]
MKPKIALVVGDFKNLKALSLFQYLGKQAEVVVCAFRSDGFFQLQGFHFKMRSYEPVEEMPGFMRGLEVDLASVDAICTFSTTHLHSYQASKVARTHQIPLLVYSEETDFEQYSQHRNVQSMHSEILKQAFKFFTPNKMAQQSLVEEGVCDEAVQILTPVVDTSKFFADTKKREKFRGYLGIPLDETVLLVQTELTQESHCDLVLKSLPNLERLHVIFAGSGPYEKQLKYLAYDMGVGDRVFFLHQDPTKFLVDLYNSVDACLCFDVESKDKYQSAVSVLPYALSCGVLPIVRDSEWLESLSGGVGYVLPEISCQSFIDTVTCFQASRMRHDQMKISNIARRQYDFNQGHKNILSGVEFTKLEGRKLGEKLISKLENFAHKKAWNTLVKSVAVSQIDGYAPAVQAQIFALAGDAYRQLGLYDESSEEYGKALQLDENNLSVLCGLGFLALYTHSYEESSMFFSRAIGVAVNHAPALTGMALLSVRLDAHKEAVLWMERSVLANAAEKALMMLVQMARDCGNGRFAIKVLERVSDAVGQEDVLVKALQKLYLDYGEVEKARGLLSETPKF